MRIVVFMCKGLPTLRSGIQGFIKIDIHTATFFVHVNVREAPGSAYASSTIVRRDALDLSSPLFLPPNPSTAFLQTE